MGKSTFEKMEAVEGLEKMNFKIIIVIEVIINRIITFRQKYMLFP